MEEKTKELKLQSFSFMVVALFLAVTTHCLLLFYGTVHWRIAGPSAHLTSMVLELQMKSSEQQTPYDTKLLDEMTKETKDLATGTSLLMRNTAAYRYTGWASLVFAIVAFFGKPRWAGWIALPPALYAAFLTEIMMMLR